MSPSTTKPQTILFVAANPKETGRLRLDQELRDIAEGLQRSQKRDEFNLVQRSAVRPLDIQRAMLDVEPQIIHFSGHGVGEQGLVFEDPFGNVKLIDGDALAGLFELFADKITGVVLNGCYSELQAKVIAHHIPYVIGMSHAIGDRAAIAFSVGFYDALGAGRDVKFAYKLGCAAICLEGISEHLTPVLLEKSTIESTTLHRSLSPPTRVASPTGGPTESLGINLNSTLTSHQRQNLCTELAGLQRRYNLLSQKIGRLGEAFDIETDPSTRFKLEIQMQQAKIERDLISREMAALTLKLEE